MLFDDNSGIHIWSASLDLSEKQTDALFKILSASEQERAKRLYTPELRRNFIAARGILRTLLGHYLEMAPDKVAIRNSGDGKPYIDHQQGSLKFNISHAGTHAAFAFCRGSEIGIDIEKRDRRCHAEKISKSFFTDRESGLIRDIREEGQKQLQFMKLWTRKEACIKYSGRGLRQSLKSFDVSEVSNSPSEVLMDNTTILVSDIFSDDSFIVGAIAYAADQKPAHRHRKWPDEFPAG